jgi:cytochrome P450
VLQICAPSSRCTLRMSLIRLIDYLMNGVVISDEKLCPAIPGPHPWPILEGRGNYIQFLHDPIAYMQMLYRRYGQIASFVKGSKVSIVKGSRGMVFAFGPAYNQQVLGTPAKFYSAGLTVPGPADSAQRRLGSGMASMNGERHKKHRRAIMPLLHVKAIEDYRDEIVSFTDRLLHSWSAGVRRDMALESKRLTLHISGKILLGLESASEADAIGECLERWLLMNTSFLVSPFRVDRPGTPYWQMLRLADRVEKGLLTIINRKRVKAGQKPDVLSLLRLESDSEAIGQAALLLIASYMTTCNALAWTLFLLAQHPSVMRDLVDELGGALHGNAPAVEQLGQLKLLESVIKETMRLLPPVVYSFRIAVEPFHIGPFELPSMTTVALSQYITHRMPDLYDEPGRFLPHRWLASNPSSYEYFPFGAGPHQCIGYSFAMMELKIALAMMLQRYRFTVIPGSRINRHVGITLSPKHGIPMWIAPQNGRFTCSAVRGNIHQMVNIQ